MTQTPCSQNISGKGRLGIWYKDEIWTLWAIRSAAYHRNLWNIMNQLWIIMHITACLQRKTYRIDMITNIMSAGVEYNHLSTNLYHISFNHNSYKNWKKTLMILNQELSRGIRWVSKCIIEFWRIPRTIVFFKLIREIFIWIFHDTDNNSWLKIILRLYTGIYYQNIWAVKSVNI